MDLTLIRAARRGDEVEVERLLQSGADVLVKDGGGSSCLHHASLSGHLEVARMLAVGGGGRLLMAKDQGGGTCLHNAAASGHLDTATMLAEKGGGELLMVQDKYGGTCLHDASRGGQLATCTMLAERGGCALLMVQDKKGKTAADTAEEQGHGEVAAMLRVAMERCQVREEQIMEDMDLKKWVGDNASWLKVYADFKVQLNKERGINNKWFDCTTWSRFRWCTSSRLVAQVYSQQYHLHLQLKQVSLSQNDTAGAADGPNTLIKQESKHVLQGEMILTQDELDQLLHATSTCRAVDKTMEKFASSLQQLKSGQPDEAAAGLMDFMCVDHGKFYDRVGKGVAGIQEEIEVFCEGSEDPDVLELRELMRYVIYEKASEKLYANGVRDEGRNGETLQDFMKHENAISAGLSEQHVVALRLYTTAAYRFMNNPLRDFERRDRGEPCPLAVTTHFAQEGIKRLRRIRAKEMQSKWGLKSLTSLKEFPSDSGGKKKTTLWRGMRNMEVSADFREMGGTEQAFMSTTTNMSVAVSYALSGGALLFKINAQTFMQSGAELSWLSAFPGENECLYPPLTYLSPTGRMQTVTVEARILHSGDPEPQRIQFVVVEVEPHMG